MKITKYPDGSSYVEISKESPSTIRINSYEDLWHLNQFVDAYNHTYNSKPVITIPNLIDAQADRRFNRGESSGLKLVLNFLNGLNANFRIFHPHNPEVVESALNNVKIIDNKEFIIGVLKEIEDEYPDVEEDTTTGYSGCYRDGRLDQNLILMSSDAGGFKPLIKLANNLDWLGEVYSASKGRSYENGKTNLLQIIDRQDFGGKDVLIIDDICVYGGTFVGLAKLLRERNIGKLYLALSHMTVQFPNNELFTLYDKVFTTNSKYDSYPCIPHKSTNGGYQPRNLSVQKLFKYDV